MRSKKILFVNPASYEGGVPNTGLAMLCAILSKRGHSARVADYFFSRKTPNIREILGEFKPDVVGISLFSCNMSISRDIIRVVNDSGIPLIAGGPHTSSYCEEISGDTRFSYVIIGEAENEIVDMVENAKLYKKPEIIYARPPDVESLPLPDYSSFYQRDSIKIYPFMSSRGCPYDCSFCASRILFSGKWRPRSIESCIKEIESLKISLPSVKQIMIWDDNFSLNIKRAKLFIETYLNKKIKYKLSFANFRADNIDKELLLLLKKAECSEVQLGVEHGDPEVFGEIEKKETLEDIKQAARLIKKCGMKLKCSCIIGLPYDTLAKTRNSIRYVKELKPNYVYWNMFVPYKGTRAYDYFKNKGQIDNKHIPLTTPPANLIIVKPNVEISYFTKEEREKAYLLAYLSLKNPILLSKIKEVFLLAFKWNLKKEFLLWFLYPQTLKNMLIRVLMFIKNKLRMT